MIDQILQGDTIEQMCLIPDKSINCCVTSPPYWGLRDYGVDGQLGLEKTPEEFVAKMVEVFSEVKRIIRDDGTLWLNLGDSYMGCCPGSRDPERWPKQSRGDQKPNFTKQGALPAKNLVGIPWMVAFALRQDGWYLRQDIIWHKPNPMPESVRDRCTKAHEYIFLLTKNPKYYCDMEAVKEPAAYAGQSRGGSTKRYEQNNAGMDNKVFNTRNKRSVWTVVTQPYKGAHFATFPEKLIEPCIRAGCPEWVCKNCGEPRRRVVEKKTNYTQIEPTTLKGQARAEGQGCYRPNSKETGGMPLANNKTTGWTDCKCGAGFTGGIVFDPFMGSGTVGMVAYKNNRHYLGTELNPEYVRLAEKRIQDEKDKAEKQIQDEKDKYALFPE